VDAVERACEPEPTEVITSNVSGVVTAIDALRLGLVGIELGAGRRTLDDIVAPQAGIVIHRHVGEPVEQGEALCSVVAQRSGATVNPAEIRSCFAIGVDARSEYLTMCHGSVVQALDVG
jgi:thymidine phosphorylase